MIDPPTFAFVIRQRLSAFIADKVNELPKQITTIHLMSNTATQQFWEQMSQLWQATTGDSDICIAVIDGPVNLTHPCFDGANLKQVSVKAQGNGLAIQHGTHVTSVIFGQHNSPVKGIAPDCRGVVVPIFSEKANGQIQASTQANLARAITKAVDNGANIVNVSAGEFSKSGESGTYLEKAIKYCEDNNVLIVSATGNNGCACVHVPASNPNVLAVGAIDNEGSPMNFSNWGNAYKENGILAPGKEIEGATPDGGIVGKTGTSFATPLVSGVVALLLSLQKQQNPTAKPDVQQIKNALLSTTISCDITVQNCDKFLRGILNIKDALKYLNLSLINEPAPAVNLQAYGGENIQIQDFKQTVKSQNSINMNEINEQAPTESAGNPVTEVVAQEVANVLPQESVEVTPVIQSPAVIDSSAVVAAPSEAAVVPSEVTPSCACGDSGDLVFALGSLWMDYPTQSVLDSFKFYMRGIEDDEGNSIEYPNPHNPKQLLAYLNGQKGKNGTVQAHHYDSARLTWILRQEEVPVYAIRPGNTYAADAYALLRDFLQPFDDKAGEAEAIDLVSIPGHIVGETKLYSGEVVPVIEPNMRAMYNWRAKDLIEGVFETYKAEKKEALSPEQEGKYKAEVSNFVHRIYHEFRNLGVTSADRAMNHMGTNVFGPGKVIQQMIINEYSLRSMSVQPSAICRPNSDCQDVMLKFFKPNDRLKTSTWVFRYTVDVSKEIPVSIGQPRSWYDFG